MYIIGCGAQAKYIIDIVGETRGITIIDPIGKKIGEFLLGHLINGFDINFISNHSPVYLAIANNKMKKNIYDELKKKEFKYPSAIHNRSTLSQLSTLGEGNIINAGAIIQPTSSLGKFNMIHSNVLIEHDCKVESFSNIGPAATLCGHVKIGNYTTVGPSSVICKTVTIGNNCIIGAGSVVLKNIPDNSIAWGNPCKIIRYNGDKQNGKKSLV